MKQIALFVALALSVATVSAEECYSSGIRKGVVQKFSAKGFRTKSWEGEMVQEGLRTKSTDSGTGVTNIWKFSVTNPAVAKKIEDVVFDGGVVVVKYCQTRFHNPLVQDTDYTVTDAKALK